MDQILQTIRTTGSAVALPIHLVIASFVTIHALLNKREVGSTLGWIGLAWLSPFFGGVFYFILGINRVRRRAARLNVPRPPRAETPRRHRVDSHHAPLERAIGAITGRPTEPDNAVTIYQNGDAAYPVMLEAIDRAKVSIALSSYIFAPDEIGERFVAALAAAHARGVAVRVIIDGVGGGYMLSPAYHGLRRFGVPAGRFLHSPLPWRMPLLNLRSHKKILVLDGRVGFTGGMNIARENVQALKPADPVQDTHFRVEGPVVAQLMAAFAADWSFVANEDLEGETWYPAIEAAGPATARVITSGPDLDLEKIEFAALQAVACARSNILIMTPYFLPDDHLVMALGLAAVRGVAVDIVVPARSNKRFVDWATRATIAPLLRDGGRVWLGPPPFRHSKIMVIDDAWSLIGSNNWDMRSFRLNFELSMEVYDRDLAVALRDFVTSHRGVALTLETITARPLPQRLRDAAVRLLMPYL